MFVMVALVGCGDGTGSSNPPSVAGSYTCVSGCNGVCTFFDITITQNGSTVVYSSAVSNGSGEINDDGEYTVMYEDIGGNPGTCQGIIAGGQATADCNSGGVNCQQAAYILN